MDFTWVKHKEYIEVNKARAFKDYSKLEFACERIQLLERIFETKWFDYLDWKRDNPAQQILPVRGKKRKLKEEESDESTSDHNGKGEAKKANTGSGSDDESDDDDEGDASLDPSSESNPEPESKPISNPVMDFSWVTDDDELDVGDAIAEKDYSRLNFKGKRIRLLEKLFENRWLKFCEWKRDCEFEREFNFDQDLDV